MAFSEDVLIRAELAEGRGLASPYLNADPQVAKELGIGMLQIGKAFGGRIRAIPISLLNRIVGLGIERPVTEEDLDRLAAHYVGVDWAIELPPMAQVDHEMLRTRGLTIEAPHAKFVRRADDLPDAPDIEVRAIEDSELPIFANVCTRAFEFPPEAQRWFGSLSADPNVIYFLAYVEGQPAGAALLTVHENFGWLAAGCSLEEFRGRGIQAALIRERIAAARDRGCEWVTSDTGADTVESPNYSYRNMVRCGFEMVYGRPFAKFGSRIAVAAPK